MTRRELSWIDLVAEVLEGGADLSGAACTRLPALHDPADRDESAEEVLDRWDMAVKVCHACPALERCRAWADQRRDDGTVLAARLPEHAEVLKKRISQQPKEQVQ